MSKNTLEQDDISFIKKIECTPQYINFDNILYCLTEKTREEIFETIKNTDFNQGEGEIDDVKFRWSMQYFDENLSPLDEDNIESGMDVIRKVAVEAIHPDLSIIKRHMDEQGSGTHA